MSRESFTNACLFFFFNDTATTEIYTLSLHDALPISLGALRRERRALPLDARDFLGPRRGLLARGGCIRVGPVSPVGRRGESRLHLCRFHLPAPPLLPGGLLLRLEVSEPRALRAELLGGSDAFDLSFLQFRLEGCQPGLDFAEPARETIDVSRSLLGLATRVNQPAIRFALFGSRFKLGATRLFRGLAGVCQCCFGRGQLLDRRFFRRTRAIAIRLGIAHVFLERFELGTPLEWSTGCGRAAVEEDGAVRAAQRAGAEHFVSGEERAHPRRSRSIDAQLVLQRVTVGGKPRARDAGEQDQRTRLGFGVPGANRIDD